MTVRSSTLAVVLLFLSPHSRLTAQPVVSANVTGVIDDNITNTSLRLNDRVTTLAGEIGYGAEFGNTYGELVFTPVIHYFSAFTERTFGMHTVTGSLVHLFDDDGNAAVSADISYGVRRGRDEFSLYDYDRVSGTLSGRYAFGPLVLGRAGYSFTRMAFRTLALFDHLEHYGFLQATVSLPTKTTVIAEAGLGTKRYADQQVTSDAGFPPGRGRMYNWQESPEPGTASPGATQFTGIVRIGQSVTSGTGLSLTARWLTIIEEEPIYLITADGDQSVEQIVNDQYGFEGPGAELRLTQLLPASIILTVTVGREQRHYNGREVYDGTGAVLADTREDMLTTASVRIEKRFPSLGFSIGISYLRTVGTSNDPLYDFSNNVIGLWIATL
jgi:hypothetical protein